jgi:LysM domain
MGRISRISRFSMIAAFALVALTGLPRGHAQVPTTVGPRAESPAAAPAAAPAPVQQPVFIPVPEGAVIQPPVEEDTGFFYLPEDFVNPDDPGFEPGPAPQLHVVRSGDTLWDICFLYFNNPWEWPKIWSYNPEITNPHWIYPGDRVRLYPEGQGPIDVAEPSDVRPAGSGEGEGEDPAELAELDAVPLSPPRQDGVRLRQLTFVDQDTREASFTIVGAVEERSMLSEGDSVYLAYPSKSPPEEGKRYTVYAETSPVRHPSGPQIIGSYARILGEVQVISVREGKRARAFITDSVDVIERGNKVGALQRTFRTVAPKRNAVDLQGTIVALVGDEQLIGQNQVVFIDKGKDDGLEVGNRMFVVRRGDALESPRSASASVGQDDRRFPARAIGEIMIVEAGKRVSTALVTLALREFGVGDGVMMRKSGE